MDLSKIQKILSIVAESGVAEVEIEEDDFKLTIRQTAPTVMMQPSAPSYPSYAPMPQAPQYGQQQGMTMQPGQAPQQQAPAGGQQAATNGPAGAPAQQAQEPGGNPSADAQAEAEEQADDVATDAETTTVTAPIVGTFYRAPAPDADSFVEVGDTVKEGDVLCIIEAMKIMNEIECETSGVVREVLVEDAEPVEFDQPLFIVETD